MKNKMKELLKIILAKLYFPDRRGSHLDQTERLASFINPEYLNHKPLPTSEGQFGLRILFFCSLTK